MRARLTPQQRHEQRICFFSFLAIAYTFTIGGAYLVGFIMAKLHFIFIPSIY